MPISNARIANLHPLKYIREALAEEKRSVGITPCEDLKSIRTALDAYMLHLRTRGGSLYVLESPALRGAYSSLARLDTFHSSEQE